MHRGPNHGAWAAAVSQQQLAALPLNGRDVFDLASQQVGVETPASANATINTGLGVHMSVKGSRPSENASRLDGIYINDSSGSAPASAAGHLLGLEAIAELNLVTAPFSDEYGRTDWGVLTAVSKSGTNEFHGALYEYVRNSDFDAKNFFDPAIGPIPAFHQNQSGGLIDGPIFKDKLFILINYEGIRIASIVRQHGWAVGRRGADHGHHHILATDSAFGPLFLLKKPGLAESSGPFPTAPPNTVSSGVNSRSKSYLAESPILSSTG